MDPCISLKLHIYNIFCTGYICTAYVYISYMIDARKCSTVNMLRCASIFIVFSNFLCRLQSTFGFTASRKKWPTIRHHSSVQGEQYVRACRRVGRTELWPVGQPDASSHSAYGLRQQQRRLLFRMLFAFSAVRPSITVWQGNLLCVRYSVVAPNHAIRSIPTLTTLT